MELSERAAGLAIEPLVFGGVFAVANRMQRVLDRVLPELTAKQFWLLVVLSQFEAPPTLTQLADAADTSHQNVKQTLDKLVAKGFVQRVPDAADRRASRVRATEEVGRWTAETAAQAGRFMSDMYAGISPEELDAFGQVLMRMHANLATAGGGA